MTRRPLKDIRPVGPIIHRRDSSDNQQNDESDKYNQPNQPEESEITVDEIEPEDERDEVTENIIEQAEKWFEGITEEGMKRKMMINYLDGITNDNVSDERIKSMVDKADL